VLKLKSGHRACSSLSQQTHVELKQRRIKKEEWICCQSAIKFKPPDIESKVKKMKPARLIPAVFSKGYNAEFLFFIG